MPFIGPKPADTILDSTLITDGSITSAKIADGTIVNADLNSSAAIATSKITGLAASATTDTTNAANIASGTIADARISASSVQQHATSFDDNKILNDLSTLGLRVHTQENLNASNTNSASFDIFQDDSGIDTETNTDRNTDEYVSAVSGSVTDTNITLNASNYSTYLDTTNAKSSFRKFTSGSSTTAGDSQNVYDPTLANTIELASGATMSASNPIAASQEATLIEAIFNSTRNNSTYYLAENNDTSGPGGYRLLYFNMGFKTGKSFKPNGTTSFRWQNGSGGFANWELHASSSTANYNGANLSTVTSSVSNGSTYSATISQSNFYDVITARVYHGSNNSIMFDSLSVAGTLREDTIVVNATGNFTGTTITAPSSVSSMGAVITYQDNAGTNALNTDIVLQLSADGGSNYSTATLTALPDFATGIKMAKVNDLSVTAGTSINYKLSFANQASGSKEARIRGVSLQY